jgi:hypothetical protein
MRVGRLGSLAFLLVGCGGAADNSISEATGGYSQISATGGRPNYWPDAGAGATGTGGQVYSTYTAQGCPDASTPAVHADCDLFSAVSGCPAGQACFPTTRSTNNPCQPEQYYYICSYTGSGAQGDACTSSHDCGQGYVCVVTNTGTKCQKMCALSDTTSCSPGMFCDPIDVSGVGTCS